MQPQQIHRPQTRASTARLPNHPLAPAPLSIVRIDPFPLAAPFEISNNGGNNFAVTIQTNLTLFGKAPVPVAHLRVNGASTNANVTWTSVTNWSLGLELPLGTNTVTVQGYGRLNQILNGLSDSIVITNKP